MTLLDIAEILEAAAGKARELASLRSAERRDWLDQSTSPLGSRRHIQAVRRRLAAGLDGAGQSGRRYLLSAEALRDELRRAGEPTEDTTAEPLPDAASALQGRLRAIAGGR